MGKRGGGREGGGKTDTAQGTSQNAALLKLYHFIQLMAAACDNSLLYVAVISHACDAALLQENI